MKKEQFDESVNRALYQASRNMELNETLRYLEKDINETEHKNAPKNTKARKEASRLIARQGVEYFFVSVEIYHCMCEVMSL